MTKRRPQKSGRDYMAEIPAVQLPVSFEAGKGFVTAVFRVGDSTLGIKFESPEHLLMFFTELMESATLAWPNDPFIRMYKSDE